MTTKKDQNDQNIDIHEVLRVVGEISATFEATLTPEERQAMLSRSQDDGQAEVVYSVDDREEAMEDFDALAAIDALSTLADEIRVVIDKRMDDLYEKCLETYYVAEELSRQPEHADLIPHVEAMRQAHEKEYGKPIPPRSVN